MVNLHYWSDHGRATNFGDALSRVIVEAHSDCSVTWAPLEKANLCAIGSVLAEHMVSPGFWERFEGVIWGSGRMYRGPVISMQRAKVTALRGRLTLERVEAANKESIALGDPGLLVADIIATLVPYAALTERYALGVFPHFSQRNHEALLRLCEHPQVLFIDAFAGVEQVLAAMMRCDHILSSSLHGLVVSDALDIPNRWLRLEDKAAEAAGCSEFKFWDYYSVFSRVDPSPLYLSGRESLRDILKQIPRHYLPELARLQEGLRNSFPNDICRHACLTSCGE